MPKKGIFSGEGYQPMVSNQGVKLPTVPTEVILLRTEMLANSMIIRGYAIESKVFRTI